MECAEDPYSQETRTPELQRFSLHTLGRYPGAFNPTPASTTVRGCHGVDSLEAEEDESEAVGRRVSPQVDIGQSALADGLRTPPTVSRHSWLQLHPHDDSAFTSAAQGRAYDAFLRSSPASLAPPVGEASRLRTARSASCPSTSRSVAPPRYSLEGGRGSSAGRHTTLLGGAGFACSGLHDTPVVRPSVASFAAVAAAAARPTTLLRASATPVERGEGCLHLNTASGEREFQQQKQQQSPHSQLHRAADRALADVYVSRLTCFSTGSGGSPGVATCIGRPTTLGCPDFDLGVHQQWDSDDDGDDEGEPWIGGATQVWRSSAELHEPVDGALRRQQQQRISQHALMAVVADEEAAVVAPAAPRVEVEIPLNFPESPEATWRSQPLMGTDAQSQPSRTAFMGERERAKEEGAKVPHEAAQHELLTSAVRSASLIGLEDAPCKSYVRSTANSPTQGDAEGARNEAYTRKEAVEWTAKGSGACTVSGDTVMIKSCYAAETIGAPIGFHACSTDQLQQRDWLYADATATTVTGEGVGETTPQGRVFSPQAQRAGVLANSAEASAADAVAAQLARLSLQASPTQKRLAFEEEEEEENNNPKGCCGGSEGNASPMSSVRMRPNMGVCGGENVSLADSAQGCCCSAFGHPLNSGRGRAGNRALHSALSTTNRWAKGACSDGGGSGGSLSGLQLLRSRKRCLEEMQATDVEVNEPRVVVSGAGVAGGDITNAGDRQGGSDASVVTVSRENLKRQKQEAQRCQRRQHFLPSDGSGDDLIPAPMRAGAASSVYSSVLAHPLQLEGLSWEEEMSQVQQPLSSVNNGGMNWSQLSSISYVTPASQSISTDMVGVPSHFSLSQRDGCPAGNSSSRAVASTSASCSQVLLSLPTNVTQRYPTSKQ